ncbi:dipeptidase [Marilutibacter alkalisoli]|uniref:dipeptidase n=1 Tax=Marilutibacter alkalisoli TaxID=2591633 RepID=UPI001FC95487|nr:dipeptidase [Lysobacter alkalisoli]
MFLDTHVDIPSTYMVEPRFDSGTDTELQVDLGKMERGGLDAAFFIIYTGQGPRTAEGYAEAVAEADRKYSAIHKMVEIYPERIALATTPDAVVANRAAGRLSAMIGIENGYSLGRSLANVDRAFERGARYLGLTHFGHNALCTSSGAMPELGDDPDDASGLTGFGRAVVQRANRLGIMVDVSHSSDACVRDVLAFSRAPIIASHSAARALADHPRNLTDDLLRGIAEKGGVIQVVALDAYVKHDPARSEAIKALEADVARAAGADAFDHDVHGELPDYVEGLKLIDLQYPPATLDDYLDHVEHIAQVAGIDHVGLASDFDGGGGVVGWRDASETQNVVEGLRRRGFSRKDVAKITSGNLLRVWREVEAVAAELRDQ